MPIDEVWEVMQPRRDDLLFALKHEFPQGVELQTRSKLSLHFRRVLSRLLPRSGWSVHAPTDVLPL
jgi:hypothetical protein